MATIINSHIFILLLVIGGYLLGRLIFTKSRFPLFNPVLIAIAVVICMLKLLDIEYETFKQGSYIIDFMLGPSVVAIGYVLYEQSAVLKGKVAMILSSVSVGAVVGIGSVILLCRLFGCDDIITYSMQPKSVTTPIAISLAERSGGVGAIASICVIITGVSGSIIAPLILKLIGVKSPIAKGLALGSAVHGMGTAKAMEIGAIEGAVAGLSIGLMGVATSLFMPIMEAIFY
ncbi:MAG: LrgB family protein [Rikenellaceae bacterium]